MAKEESPLLGWIVAGVIGLAIGVFLGLGVANLTGRTPAEQDEVIADQQQANLGKQEELVQTTVQTGQSEDWGPLKSAREPFGPGTHFAAFVKFLEAKQMWPRPNWKLQLGNCPEAVVSDFVPGEGKVYCDVIYNPLLILTMIYMVDRFSNMDKAAENLRKRLTVYSMAFGLSKEEQDRFETVLGMLVFFRPGAEKKAMEMVVAKMPTHIVKDFRKAQKAVENVYTTMELGIDPPQSSPAIGFPLSDRMVVDVVFAAADITDAATKQDYDGGPWWSLVIYSRKTRYLTTPPDQCDKGEIHWPRLTLKEVDALE